MDKAGSRGELTDCGWVTTGLEIKGSNKGGDCGRVVLADPADTEGIATIVEWVFLVAQWAPQGGLCHESCDEITLGGPRVGAIPHWESKFQM